MNSCTGKLIAHYVEVFGKLSEKQFQRCLELGGPEEEGFNSMAEYLCFELSEERNPADFIQYLKTIPGIKFYYTKTYGWET